MSSHSTWHLTHAATGDGEVRYAGKGIGHALDGGAGVGREEREAREDTNLVAGAARAVGAGDRPREEEPDPWRTCFERDRDRILHSNALRRLAGKTQVFVVPDDHQRTRLTHALEVAQIAEAMAAAVGLNATLAYTIGIGHDCGHGPGGHASEEAFDPYIPGFHHAQWGADVTLAKLNLTFEVTDGIRNHSWSRPQPATAEGAIVRWADRIAYCAHDWEDAVSAGIVTWEQLPDAGAQWGRSRGALIGGLVDAVIGGTLTDGHVGMEAHGAEALATLRSVNYDLIYNRPASVTQADRVISLLRALVDFYIDRPNQIPAESRNNPGPIASGSADAVTAAVEWVSGMTDRFAYRTAVSNLGWDRNALPYGVDIAPGSIS